MLPSSVPTTTDSRKLVSSSCLLRYTTFHARLYRTTTSCILEHGEVDDDDDLEDVTAASSSVVLGSGEEADGWGIWSSTSRANSSGLSCAGTARPWERSAASRESTEPWCTTAPRERRRRESTAERRRELGWWMESTTVVPRAAATARRQPTTTCAEEESRPEVGSSRRRTPGSRRRASPMDTRRRSPPDSRVAETRVCAAWPSRRSARRAATAADASAAAGYSSDAAKANVSATVSNGSATSICGTWADNRRNEDGRSGAALRSSLPCVGAVRAARMSSRVDLPAPLGPTTARISPGRAVSDTSRRMYSGDGGCAAPQGLRSRASDATVVVA
ncbi:hypothetical protein EE612_033804, partial [Oryza sativa]